MITEIRHAEYGRLRATVHNGEPYICLTDITKMLRISNAQLVRTTIPEKDVLQKVDESTKTKRTRLFIKAEHVSTAIFKSTYESAEQVGEWVYLKVLPRILNITEDVEKFKDPCKIVEFLKKYHKLKIRNQVLETEQKINAPKIKYINKLLGSTQCVDLEMATHVIKYPGLKPTDLYIMLRNLNIIDSNNIAYQEYCDKKYFRVVTTTAAANGANVTIERTYVYKSGIAFIERLLKKYEVGYDRNGKGILHDT